MKPFDAIAKDQTEPKTTLLRHGILLMCESGQVNDLLGKWQDCSMASCIPDCNNFIETMSTSLVSIWLYMPVQDYQTLDPREGHL